MFEKELHKLLILEAYKSPSERNPSVIFAGGDIWEYRKSISNDSIAVYTSQAGNSIVAFRGTKNLKDAVPDLHVFVGSEAHSTFPDAVKDVKNVEEVLGQKSLLVGHSLGGSRAHHVSKMLGNQAVLYNPGSSPFFKTVVDRSKVTVRRSEQDVISEGYSSETPVRLNLAVEEVIGTAFNHGIEAI